MQQVAGHASGRRASVPVPPPRTLWRHVGHLRRAHGADHEAPQQPQGITSFAAPGSPAAHHRRITAVTAAPRGRAGRGSAAPAPSSSSSSGSSDSADHSSRWLTDQPVTADGARLLRRLLRGWRAVDATDGAPLGVVRDVSVAGGDDDEEDEEDEEENDDEDSDDEQQQQHEGGGGGAQLSGHLLLLCVRRGARVAGMAEGWAGDEVHRVPLVPELVVRCDRAARTLAVRPPPGLLDLGRRQLIVDYLAEALAPYASPQEPKGPEGRGGRGGAGGPVLVMPSRAALEAAGRPDLAKLVARAGGAREVATALGWVTYRRPAGYYDDPENLDAELDLLVDAAWLEMPVLPSAPADPRGDGAGGGAAGTGKAPPTYWYNQISGEVSVRRPAPLGGRRRPPGGGPRAPRSASRPMPTTAQLIALGRSDLAHATRRYGGVLAVADMLGRRPVGRRRRRRKKGGGEEGGEEEEDEEEEGEGLLEDGELREELGSLAEELGLAPECMPTITQLQEAGRSDLIREVRARGATWHAAAGRLGLAARRRAKGELRDLGRAACDLMRFMLEQQHAGKGAAAPLSAQQQQRQPGGDGGGEDEEGEEERLRAAVAEAARGRSWPGGRRLRLPTQAQLVAAGRFDLLCALRLHERGALEERCGLTRLQAEGSVPVALARRSPTPAGAVLDALRRLCQELNAAVADAEEEEEEEARGGLGVARAQRLLAERGVAASRQQLRTAFARLRREGLVVAGDG